MDLDGFTTAAAQLPAGPFTATQYGGGNCGVLSAPEPHFGSKVGEQVGLINAGFRRDAAGALAVAEALATVLSAAPTIATAVVQARQERDAAIDEAGRAKAAAVAELAKLRAQLAVYRDSDKRTTLFKATRAYRVRDGWHLVNKPENGLASSGFTYKTLEALQRDWAVVIGARGRDPRHADCEYVEVLRLEDELARVGVAP